MKIRRIAGQSPFDAAGLLRIYEESFPPAEREPADALLAEIRNGDRACLVAEQDMTIAGLAVWMPLPAVNVQYLEYLAVAAPLRSRGIGGELLDRLVLELASTEPGCQGIVFEVEPPGLVDGAERALRERRIAFYQRHRASLVACAPDYRAPSFEGDGALNFLLMWLALPGGPAALEGPMLRTCVTAMLVESYGLPAHDPLVEDVVARLTC
jgi:ribosomal protein S18 acetylase RimI-like enzyme